MNIRKFGLFFVLVLLLVSILSIPLPAISFGSGTSSISARIGVTKSVSIAKSGSGSTVSVTTRSTPSGSGSSSSASRPTVSGSGSSTPIPTISGSGINTPKPTTPTPTKGPDFDPIAHEHDFKAVTHIPAGCGTYGKAVLQCWCGATRYKTLDYEKPISEHFWSPYKVQIPDCTSNVSGKIFYHCLYCGKEKVEYAGYNHDFKYVKTVTLTYANGSRTYQAKEYECTKCHGKQWEKID